MSDFDLYRAKLNMKNKLLIRVETIIAKNSRENSNSNSISYLVLWSIAYYITERRFLSDIRT